VYDYPFQEVAEDNEDLEAHYDKSAPKVLTYIAYSKDHEFMLEKQLPQDKSITYKLFEDINEEEEVNYESEIEDEDGNKVENSNCLYVEDIIREEGLHFFKIPKLGSYIAIPLIYQDCLT